MHTGGCNARARPSGKGATTPTAPPTTLRCVGATAQEGATARSRTPHDAAAGTAYATGWTYAHRHPIRHPRELGRPRGRACRHRKARCRRHGPSGRRRGLQHATARDVGAVTEHRIPGVRGNHDLMAIGRLPADQCGPVGRKAIGWTRKVLTEADCDYLASLPDELRLEGGILCTHSALGDPCVRLHARGQFEEETKVLLHFDGDLRVCCTGHTHLQEVVEVAAGGVVRRPAVPQLVLNPAAFCFLNPGSVGQPRDGDERAAYAVFDSETYHVWFHRVAYDVRRITRENARRGIRIGPRAAQGQSLMSRLFSSVP